MITFPPFERTEEKYFGYHIGKRLRHQTAIFFFNFVKIDLRRQKSYVLVC